MTTTVKRIIGGVAACLALGAMAETPVISDVTVRQRWPWSKLVDIDYVLSGAPQRMDIAVSAFNGANPLTLTETSLTGDLYGVSDGAHRIVWDPTVTAYTNAGVLGQFRVALTPSVSPLYMIVDLTKAAGADGQIEYVYETALTNGLWGAWVRKSVTNSGTVVESVVWTGVTTNDVYKTDKLVMRRIHASGVDWRMGAPAGEVGQYNVSWMTNETQHRVVLSKDYYISVFEFTQGQNTNLTKSASYTGSYNKSDRAVHPLEFISFNDARGDASSNADYNWPNGKKVKPTGLFGRLASLTGFLLFDAPTEAQWEYACRAGTTTGLNNGTELANNNDPVASGVVGWVKGVAGNDPDNTQKVGLKEPNSWGIYDMHGNVAEWCRDWWYNGALGDLNQTINPAGPTNGTYRVIRGGFMSQWPFYIRSACRETKATPGTWGSQAYGFRIVCELPLRNVQSE